MQPCRETASRTAPFVQSLRQSQPSEKQTAYRQQLPVQAAACTAAPHKRRMRPYYVPIKPRGMIRRQRNQAHAADQSRSAETLKKPPGASLIAAIFESKYSIPLRGKVMDFRQIIGNVRPHAVRKQHKPLRSCLIPEVSGKAISAAGENHPAPVNICFRPFLRSK